MSSTGTKDWTELQSGRRFQGLEGGEKDAHFIFAVLADTQLGFNRRDDDYEPDMKNSERSVEILNTLRPKFAVVCGDLTNMIPEIYPKLDPTLRDRQVRDFKRIFSKVDPSVPLVCVCGNHDIGNKPTPETTKRYRNDFGDDYFSFTVHNVCFVALNTNLISDPSGYVEAYEEQYSWLDQVLSEAVSSKVDQVILMGHHPLFLRTDDEPTKDPSLGMDEIVDAYTRELIRFPRDYFHIPLERRERLLAVLAKYGVRYFFSGHFHRNLIVHSTRYQVTNVVTSAVGKGIASDPEGYRLVSVMGSALNHKFYPLYDPLPSAADLTFNETLKWN